MKRLILLILLLPILAQAQIYDTGTLQRNRSDSTVRGNFGSRGLMMIPTVSTLGTNGQILVFNSATNKYVPTDQSAIIPSLSATSPIFYSSGVISSQAASGSQNGYLTSTDWTTFNNKIGGSGTSFYVPYFNASSTITNSPMRTDGYSVGFGKAPSGSSGLSIEALKTIDTQGDINADGNIDGGGHVQGAELRALNIGAYYGSIKSTNLTGNRTYELPNTSGTFLLDNGSGSGLSGVVLTSGNQNVAGLKTFSSRLTINNSTLNGGGLYSTATGVGGHAIYAQADSAHAAWLYNSGTTNEVLRVEVGNLSGNLASFRNTGGVTALITNNGTISSTPQGTLYGTATGSITSSQLATSLTDETGTGSAVFSASPTFTGTVTTPALNLSSSTASTAAAWDASKNLVSVTNTGTGNNVLATSPTLVTPNIGAATATSLTTSASSSFGGSTTNGSVTVSAANSSAAQYILGNSAGVAHWSIYESLGAAGQQGSLNFFSLAAPGSVANINLTTGAYTATSDRNFKKNIKASGLALDLVKKIPIKQYDWKADNVHEPFGVIAQELYKVAPTYASKPESQNGKWGVAKAEMVPMLIKAMQEQQDIIEKLESRIKALEK